MANAGKCNQDIYEKGQYVGMIVGGDANVIEAYIKFVAEKSGEPVDWHYAGGRGRVLTTGDVKKVKRTLIDYQLRVTE